MGFEPMNNGFAIRPLSPLGYAAKTAIQDTETETERQARLHQGLVCPPRVFTIRGEDSETPAPRRRRLATA